MYDNLLIDYYLTNNPNRGCAVETFDLTGNSLMSQIVNTTSTLHPKKAASW